MCVCVCVCVFFGGRTGGSIFLTCGNVGCSEGSIVGLGQCVFMALRVDLCSRSTSETGTDSTKCLLLDFFHMIIHKSKPKNQVYIIY